MTGPLETARAEWGEALPEWVEAMALECARTSQNHVANRLGRSAAMISNILRNRYPSPLAGIEDQFRGVFQNATIRCPALGELPTHECRAWREKSRDFALGNPLRVRMFRACGDCPRNKKEDDDATARSLVDILQQPRRA